MVPRPNGLARQPWHSDNLCSTIWMRTSRMVVFSVFYRLNASRTYSFCFFYTLEVNEHSYWFVFLHFCSLFWGKQGVNKWINSFPPKKTRPSTQISSGALPGDWAWNAMFTSCLFQISLIFLTRWTGVPYSSYPGFENLFRESVFGLSSYAPRNRGGSETFL